MNIQIFGGIGEIGGNKIFVEIGDKKFLFDFGLLVFISFESNVISELKNLKNCLLLDWPLNKLFYEKDYCLSFGIHHKKTLLY